MNQFSIIDSNRFTEFFDIPKKPRKIDHLVIHHIQANSIDHAIQQLLQHQVSAHYIISEEGIIYKLVEEDNIAYHAGVSFWRGVEGLNYNSLGIEFVNSDPFKKRFTEKQISIGAEFSKYLITKYQISFRNVVGHSDIAYNKETKLLDRKQDPSHLFDWKYFAKLGVGIMPTYNFSSAKPSKPKNKVLPTELTSKTSDKILFKPFESSEKIAEIKTNLKNFGYLVSDINKNFDLEMQCLARVFNRRFNQEGFVKNSDCWYFYSDLILNYLIENLSD